MRPNPVFIIRHLRNVYGGSVSYKENCLFVTVGNDKFRVNLTDGKRFGYYTFFHRDVTPRDGVYHYHSQLKDSDLAHGLFKVWCHEFNRDIGIWSTDEDWARFVNDAYSYCVKSERQFFDIKSLCENRWEEEY